MHDRQSKNSWYPHPQILTENTEKTSTSSLIYLIGIIYSHFCRNICWYIICLLAIYQDLICCQVQLIILISLLPSISAKKSFSNTLVISKTTFHFTATISIALCWPIVRETLTVSHLTYTCTNGVKPCRLLEKLFPEEFPRNHKSVEQDLLLWGMKQFPGLQLLPFHFLGQKFFSFQLVGNIDEYRSG